MTTDQKIKTLKTNYKNLTSISFRYKGASIFFEKGIFNLPLLFENLIKDEKNQIEKTRAELWLALRENDIISDMLQKQEIDFNHLTLEHYNCLIKYAFNIYYLTAGKLLQETPSYGIGFTYRKNNRLYTLKEINN